MPVARFGARVRVTALCAVSEPSQVAVNFADGASKEKLCMRLSCALVVSANARPLSGTGHWDTSLKPPRLFCHRQRFGGFPVARSKKEASSSRMVLLFWYSVGRGSNRARAKREKRAGGTFWCPRACHGAVRRERAEPRKEGLHRQRVKKNNCVPLGCALVASAVRRPHSCPPNRALP